MRFGKHLSLAATLWLLCEILAATTLTAPSHDRLPPSELKTAQAGTAGGGTGSNAEPGAARQHTTLAGQLDEQQFQLELARLGALARAGDLDKFTAAAELEQTWGPAGGEYYGLLMLNISNLFVNGFHDERIYKLSQQYALNAPDRADSFSLDLKTKLLPFIAMDLAPASDGAASVWAKERSEKARLWLRAWRRLEHGLDKSFNFDDRPRLKVAPPEGTGLPAGVSPDAVKDPQLRARYQAAIDANLEKSREYDRQFVLRFINRTFPQKAEQYLSRAYSKPPHNTEELKQYLDAYLRDEGLKKQVLDAALMKSAEARARQ
jgi:hypothetical protein